MVDPSGAPECPLWGKSLFLGHLHICTRSGSDQMPTEIESNKYMLLWHFSSASAPHAQPDLRPEEGLEVLVSHVLLQGSQGPLPAILVVL